MPEVRKAVKASPRGADEIGNLGQLEFYEIWILERWGDAKYSGDGEIRVKGRFKK